MTKLPGAGRDRLRHDSQSECNGVQVPELLLNVLYDAEEHISDLARLSEVLLLVDAFELINQRRGLVRNSTNGWGRYHLPHLPGCE